MGAKSHRKGYIFEHDVVTDLRSHGIDSRRIPLSGGDPNEPGDIEIAGFGLCEAKNRESIGEYLWEWLGENKALFLKRNRREPLVVMRLDEWERLVDAVMHGGGQDAPERRKLSSVA
ncbi:MAG: hypothetical protein PHF64_00340 [Methanoregula sp.]|nr:hypothetical protein [Methanoregula sp.]